MNTVRQAIRMYYWIIMVPFIIIIFVSGFYSISEYYQSRGNNTYQLSDTMIPRS